MAMLLALLTPSTLPYGVPATHTQNLTALQNDVAPLECLIQIVGNTEFCWKFA